MVNQEKIEEDSTAIPEKHFSFAPKNVAFLKIQTVIGCKNISLSSRILNAKVLMIENLISLGNHS